MLRLKPELSLSLVAENQEELALKNATGAK
jgi:hypothetical protein